MNFRESYFCSLPFSKDLFCETYKYLTTTKDRIRFLTTTKALYRQIPHLPINEKIALCYLCNHFDNIDDYLPAIKRCFSHQVIQLNCRDPHFSLSNQFAVFSKLFSIGHYPNSIRLILNGKMKIAKDVENVKKNNLRDLLALISHKDPLLNAIYKIKLLFLRFNDNLHRICNHLPNLLSFTFLPFFDYPLVNRAIYLEYIKLLNERNFAFKLNVSPFLNIYCKEENEHKEFINLRLRSFKFEVFDHMSNPSRVIEVPDENNVTIIGLRGQ